MLIDCETLEIRPQCYWRVEQIEAIEGEPIELIRQELNRSIELTLRSDVPVGVALSGGIDSGAIAALAAHQYKDTLQLSVSATQVVRLMTNEIRLKN
jgi:asparagine synthase (glutamine-hydrolysing)